MNPVKTFFNIVEMRTKVVSMSTFALASIASAVFLYRQSVFFPWTEWFLMLAATLAVDMGTTGFNTYFDFIKGVDRKETNREEEKVLVHYGVSPAQAFFTSAFLFLAAAVLGIIIAIRNGWPVAFIGAGCMLAGFFYSAGPKPISHTPFGELFSGGFLGAVLFGIAWFVLTGNYSAEPFLLSIPLSLMISGILTVNNNCDLESDRSVGRKTLSILLGATGGRILLWSEYACALILFFYLQYIKKIVPDGFLPVSAVLLMIMIFLFIRMERRGYNADTKGPSMRSILNIFVTGSLLLVYPWIIEFCSAFLIEKS